MPSRYITKANNQGCYFVTCTVTNWYYLFNRHNRWQILANALNFAMQQKRITLYGYVFMLNHIHLLFSSEEASVFLRDFKKFTSKKLKENMVATEPQIVSLFKNKEGEYQLWQKTNMPIFIESDNVFEQKIEYIHFNPVKKQYVEIPKYWKWSSANHNSCIQVEGGL